jgi:hypothetical protein
MKALENIVLGATLAAGVMISANTYAADAPAPKAPKSNVRSTYNVEKDADTQYTQENEKGEVYTPRIPTKEQPLTYVIGKKGFDDHVLFYLDNNQKGFKEEAEKEVKKGGAEIIKNGNFSYFKLTPEAPSYAGFIKDRKHFDKNYKPIEKQEKEQIEKSSSKKAKSFWRIFMDIQESARAIGSFSLYNQKTTKEITSETYNPNQAPIPPRDIK